MPQPFPLPPPLISPPHDCEPEVFLQFVSEIMLQQLRSLRIATVDGQITPDARVGVMVQGIMRGIYRIDALPEHRELTDDEVELFHSGLWQIVSNALCLLVEMPFEPMAITIAGFDTREVQ